jgi:CDP-diacylglycerol--glycerol-3-phosphate 3-phosphatidyltransferase
LNGSFVSAATRQRVRDLATPIARGLGRLGLTSNALTLIGFLGTFAAAWAAASQLWALTGVLVLVFGVFDLFDGTLARATGTTSKFGAFLDSTFDRAGEAVVYVGIAAGCLAGGFDLGAVLAAAAMAAAFMVSYTRAKAESLGFASGTGLVNIGFAPREVRIAILALGLVGISILAGQSLVCDGAFNSGTAPSCFVGGRPGLIIMTATLGLITILSALTVIQRTLHVRAQSREG